MREFLESKWLAVAIVGVFGIIWLRAHTRAAEAQRLYDIAAKRAADAQTAFDQTRAVYGVGWE